MLIVNEGEGGSILHPLIYVVTKCLQSILTQVGGGMRNSLTQHCTYFFSPYHICDTHSVLLFPGHTSTMRKKTLTREDLFCEPNFDELREIALDPATGVQRRLNQGQLESILSEGEFEVDSREFPNQKHMWALSQFLIKGKNKSHETLLKDLARALHLLSEF